MILYSNLMSGKIYLKCCHPSIYERAPEIFTVPQNYANGPLFMLSRGYQVRRSEDGYFRPDHSTLEVFVRELQLFLSLLSIIGVIPRVGRRAL